LGRRGVPHEHIQFGTGTWDPLVGAAMATRAGSVHLQASAWARVVLLTNAHGYRAGDRFTLLTSAARPVAPAWTASAGLQLARENAERWDGRVENEGNLGRTDLMALAGISRSLLRGGTAGVTVLLPLLTEAHGAQVSYPLIVSLNRSR
jgi:hypothetical protein